MGVGQVLEIDEIKISIIAIKSNRILILQPPSSRSLKLKVIKAGKNYMSTLHQIICQIYTAIIHLIYILFKMYIQDFIKTKKFH